GGQHLLTLLGVDLAGGAVDGDDDAFLVVVALVDGQADGFLDAGEDHVARDVLFAVQVLNPGEQLFAVHARSSNWFQQVRLSRGQKQKKWDRSHSSRSGF